ncbi:Sperm receptor for egg jelly, partial [Orchesella cincta]
ILQNWTEARSYCEDISMQLATITSVPQAKFLESTFKTDNISGLYWTAGWDKNKDGKFKWDKTEDKITKFKKYPLTILQNEDKDEPQCLAYSAGDNKSFVYFKMGCNKELFTLCETLLCNKTISGRFAIIVTEIICIIFAYLLLRLCLQQLGKKRFSREKQNRVLAANLIISDE